MVYVHLAQGFEEIEALMVVDVLRRAAIEVKTISVTQHLLVEGSHGIKVQADLLFEDADYNSCRMLVLPGGMPGAKNLQEHQGLTSKIRAFDKEKKYLAAICAAPMILGTLGLLKQKQAVCYPGWEKYLEGAEYVDKPCVVSDHIITGKGVGVADLFAIQLVKTLKDDMLANDVEKKMLLRS